MQDLSTAQQRAEFCTSAEGGSVILRDAAALATCNVRLPDAVCMVLDLPETATFAQAIGILQRKHGGGYAT